MNACLVLLLLLSLSAVCCVTAARATSCKSTSSTNACLNSADALLEQEKSTEGVACLKKCIALAKKKQNKHEEAAAWVNLYLAQKDTVSMEESRQALSKAIALAPDFALPLYLLAESQEDHQRAGRSVGEEGGGERVMETYWKAVQGNCDFHELRETDKQKCLRALIFGHHNLGAALKTVGRYAEAANQLEKAVTLSPSFEMGLNTLAGVYERMGQIQRALDTIRKSIQVNPTSVHGQYLYASIISHVDIQQSYTILLKCIELQPSYYEGHTALVQVLGQMRAAGMTWVTNELIQSRIDGMIRLQPNNAMSFSIAGNSWKHIGNAPEAVKYYKKALKLDPMHVESYVNLGATYSELNEHKKAVKLFETAVKRKLLHPVLFNNLGTGYEKLKMIEKSVEAYRTAVTMDPTVFQAHHNLAKSLENLNRFTEAIQVLMDGLKYFPSSDSSSVYHFSDDASADIVRMKQYSCDWRDREYWLTQLRDILSRHRSVLKLSPSEPMPRLGSGATGISVYPFFALSNPLTSAEHRDLGMLLVRSTTNWQTPVEIRGHPQPLSKRNRPVHVAFISSDFTTAAVGLLLHNAFSFVNRSLVHVTSLSTEQHEVSIMRMGLQKHSDFIDVDHMSDEQLAQFIINKNIDVLIDLNGHTKGSRLNVFTFSPAPIQCSFLGFVSSVGSSHVPCYFIDPTVVPPDQPWGASSFTERLVYLPTPYILSSHKYPHLPIWVPAPPEEMKTVVPFFPRSPKPFQPFIFCSFNQIYKLEPELWTVWMSILRRTASPSSQSILWLLHISGAVTDGEKNLRMESMGHGIDSATNSSKIVFTPQANFHWHLEAKSHADLFLDSVVFNGHTTAIDSLWAGLPLLSMYGRTASSRVSATLLESMQLPELMVHSLKEYEDLAVRLATDGF